MNCISVKDFYLCYLSGLSGFCDWKRSLRLTINDSINIILTYIQLLLLPNCYRLLGENYGLLTICRLLSLSLNDTQVFKKNIFFSLSIFAVIFHGYSVGWMKVGGICEGVDSVICQSPKDPKPQNMNIRQ